MNTDTKTFGLSALFAILLGIGWYLGLVYAPTEAAMGDVYRIIYLHVPSAFAAFLTSAILCGFSIVALKKASERSVLWMKATAEVGLMLTILTLITGSVWGKPTWGTWWTWDARLTTTLLLAILYAAFLLLFASMAPGPDRRRALAVLGIIIFADVPIIYKSVEWWRTLHQPADLIPNRGSNMNPEMLQVLIINLIMLMVFAVWVLMVRASNLKLAAEIEDKSLNQLS